MFPGNTERSKILLLKYIFYGWLFKLLCLKVLRVGGQYLYNSQWLEDEPDVIDCHPDLSVVFAFQID